jgi:hypothetical protein
MSGKRILWYEEGRSEYAELHLQREKGVGYPGLGFGGG